MICSSSENLCNSEKCHLHFRLYCKVQEWLATKFSNLRSTPVLYLITVQLHLIPLFCSVPYFTPSRVVELAPIGCWWLLQINRVRISSLRRRFILTTSLTSCCCCDCDVTGMCRLPRTTARQRPVCWSVSLTTVTCDVTLHTLSSARATTCLLQISNYCSISTALLDWVEMASLLACL